MLVSLRSMRLLKPQSVLPGPASTKTSAPAFFIVSTQSSHFTGLAACLTRLSLMSAAFVTISAETLATTGIFASRISTLSSSAASFFAAGSINVL